MQAMNMHIAGAPTSAHSCGRVVVRPPPRIASDIARRSRPFSVRQDCCCTRASISASERQYCSCRKRSTRAAGSETHPELVHQLDHQYEGSDRDHGLQIPLLLASTSVACLLGPDKAVLAEEVVGDQAGPRTFSQWVLTIASIGTAIALVVVTVGVGGPSASSGRHMPVRKYGSRSSVAG